MLCCAHRMYILRIKTVYDYILCMYIHRLSLRYKRVLINLLTYLLRKKCGETRGLVRMAVTIYGTARKKRKRDDKVCVCVR